MVKNIEDINDANAPTPIADRYQHIANFGEFVVLFSGSVGCSFAALQYRSLEVVLGFLYALAIAYLTLNYSYAPRATIFRMAAITLGVGFGFREIFMLFPLPLINAVLLVLGVIFLCLIGLRWYRSLIG